MTYEFDKLYDRLCDLRKAVSYANIQLVRYKALQHYQKVQGI